MKKLLTCLALSFVAASSYAATPLWLRDVQISPDGTEIAFCYKGDTYEVGMSFLGEKILYELLNSHENWWCERAFMP